MLRPGIPVTFEELDVAASLPACVPVLAAAMAAGWRLVNDEYANHEDVLTGCKSIRDFKGAHPRRLQRFMTFRFQQRLILIVGEMMRVEEFIGRCAVDRVFLRAAQNHPRYQHWWQQLCHQLPLAVRSLSPTEHNAFERALIVPMGGNRELMKCFDHHYQNSWS